MIKHTKRDMAHEREDYENMSDHERFEYDALLKRLGVNAKISDSAQHYVQTLLGLQDNRKSGHGIDAVDRSFSPPIFYEIKTSLRNVILYNTQFHYQQTDSRTYIIAVKREDNLKTYKKVRRSGKNTKLVNYIHQEESLLLDFGDIYVIPIELVKEHYIFKMTEKLIKSKGKKFKGEDYSHFIRNMHTLARKELEKTINIRTNGESVAHEDREGITLSFGNAREIVTSSGEHYHHLKKNGVFKRDYKWTKIDGPSLSFRKNKQSELLFKDIDYRVIDELVSRLTHSSDNENKIQLINRLKEQRLSLYEEIQKLKKINFGFSLEEHPNLEERLNALVKWHPPHPYQQNLFDQKNEIPF